jgi:chitin synthase
MAGRPPPSSLSSHGSSSDPFADRPRGVQFQEPQVRPFDSTVSLSQEFGAQGQPYEDEEAEKLPLTGGNVPAGYYPPG